MGMGIAPGAGEVLLRTVVVEVMVVVGGGCGLREEYIAAVIAAPAAALEAAMMASVALDIVRKRLCAGRRGLQGPLLCSRCLICIMTGEKKCICSRGHVGFKYCA
jgi:hypothetical protein